MSVHDHPWLALEAQALARGDAQALRFPEADTEATFSQWAEDARALAKALIDLGVRPGEHVALLAENRIEWPATQMAVAAAGAVFAPLNTHYRREDLIVALNQCEARVIITSERFRSNAYLDTLQHARHELPHLKHVIILGSRHDGCLNFDELVETGRRLDVALPEPDPCAPGGLLYTSGTTGVPKGAVLTHRAMMMDARETAVRLGIRAGDRWTSIIPLFHCAGCIMNILGGLQFGACYVGVPAFTPETMFRVIERERCTALSGVPTSYLAMLEDPGRAAFDLSSLRTGSCGGADCNPDVLKRCAVEFPMPHLTQVYGQTETSTIVACCRFDDPLRFETAGPPLPGLEVRISDPETCQALPSEEIGEIQARGPMIMTGYHNQPEATAEAIVDGGWLRTGDMGFLSRTGHLVIAGGRLRDMIIRGGENIYPAEIENLLLDHLSIENVAVFGVPDDYYGEQVAAAVIPASQVAADELRSYCAERIARFKVPVDIFEAETFPLTPSGKIRKTELREMVSEGRLKKLD